MTHLRRLDDDDIASKKCWSHLAACKLNGEVPWYDCSYNTKWSVSSDDLSILVVLDDLLWHVQLKGKSAWVSRRSYGEGNTRAPRTLAISESHV